MELFLGITLKHNINRGNYFFACNAICIIPHGVVTLAEVEIVSVRIASYHRVSFSAVSRGYGVKVKIFLTLGCAFNVGEAFIGQVKKV